MTFPWIATLITREPLAIAAVVASTRLPWLFFALPAGVITDRFDRRRLIYGMDFLRLVGAACLAGFFLWVPLEALGGYGIWALCLGAFLLGSAEVLRDNTAQSYLPKLVPNEKLEQSNGWLWSAENIANSFVGPPLAGFLIAVSLPLPLFANSAAYLVAFFLVWSLYPAEKVTTRGGENVIDSLRDGVVYLWKHYVLRDLAVLLSVLNAAHMMTLAVLVLFAQDVLGLGPTQYGLLLTSGAAGGVLGGIIASPIAKRLGAKLTLVLSVAIMTLSLLLIFLTSSYWIVWIALFIQAFAAVSWNVVTVSLRQRIIPIDLIGRVNSVYRFFGWGSMPIGAALGGFVATGLGAFVHPETALRLPFAIAAMLAAGVAVYVWTRLKSDDLKVDR